MRSPVKAAPGVREQSEVVEISDIINEEEGAAFFPKARAPAPTAATPIEREPDRAAATSTPVTREINSEGQHGEETPQLSQQQQPPQSSPRLKYIFKLRTMEEDSINQCRGVLRKMKQALQKQRNVSMDVKSGTSEIEELLDVVLQYRRNWMSAESSMRRDAPRHNIRPPTREAATSPPVVQQQEREAAKTGKKPNTNADGWQTATRKKTRARRDDQPVEAAQGTTTQANQQTRERTKPKKARERPEAVLVRPTDGSSYADVLRSLRSKIKPGEAEVAIRSMRKTKTGALLLELEKGGNKASFCQAIQGTLKDAAVVSELKSKATLEIRDLDALTDAEEVTAAMKSAIGNPEEELSVRITGANHREQRRAFVELSAEAANKVLGAKRVLIGWTSCRVKLWENAKRCYRCFGLGHLQMNCKGPDRKGEGVCIRCGDIGHKMKECTKPPRCCICVQQGKITVDHIPGSAKCSARTTTTAT